jgi:hypothetical protein
MRTPVTRHQRERRRRAHRGRECGDEPPPTAAADDDGPRAPERDQHAQHPQRREPDVHQPPPPPRIGPKRPRIDFDRRRRRQAQTRGGKRVRYLGRDARPSVGVDEEADAAAVFRQEPAERVGAPDDALARRLPLALQRFDDPGGFPPPPRPSTGRALVWPRASAVMSSRLAGPYTARTPATSAIARLRQRERLSGWRRRSIIDFDGHLVQRQQAEPVGRRPPALHDLRPGRRPGERIARRARGMRGHDHTDCGDEGRKSPAPGRHGREVKHALRARAASSSRA